MGESDEEFNVTKDHLPGAEQLAALKFTDEERELMLEGLNSYYSNYQKLREVEVKNSHSPAFGFDPRPTPPFFFSPDYPPKTTKVDIERPENLEELAFLPITHLAHLIKNRLVSSLELTEMYLQRLERYNKELECVITYTSDLAREQAKKADMEIAEGHYRGLLHGIPYGIKDLFSHPDYPTTWGAMPYKNQILKEKATVITKLEEAGAVMIAKLTLGALAWGDVWFNGVTKSPYNTEKGSSGSSAGSASAVSAGLVAFAIGTETWGSIISPSTRCASTGLRPTFGRVSRHGAMALSWTMDKVGPICRTVEDCAIVFDKIHGADGLDPYVISKPFNWNVNQKISDISVGYDPVAFESIEDEEIKEHNLKVLEFLRNKGINFKEIKIPEYPISELGFILSAEAATAFDELTLSDKDDELVRQEKDAWPNLMRQSRLIPAVEYIRANRIRRIIMMEMEKILNGIDVYLAPSFSNHLLLTNLTGHPAVVVPTGFKEEDNLPTSITFIGNLFHESKTLALAKFYQDAHPEHRKQPEKFSIQSKK